MGSITLEVEKLAAEATPLYCRYIRQMKPQPAFVALTEFGVVHAGYSGEIGCVVPPDVAHNRTLRWNVPPMVRGSVLAELVQSEEVRALLERVHAGRRVEWDGKNYVGRLDLDASEASEALERIFEGIDESQCASVRSVDDWLFSSCDLFDHWKTDVDLDAAVAEVEKGALAEGVVLDGDVEQCLLQQAKLHFDKGDERLCADHVAALLAAGKITQAEANSFWGIVTDGEIEIQAVPGWEQASAQLWWRRADREVDPDDDSEGWQGTPYQVADAGMGHTEAALKLVAGWLEMQG